MQRKKIFSFILPNVWQLGHFRRESLVCFVQRFWSDGGNVDENHQCYSKIQNSSRVYEKELGARVTWLWVAITYCKIALQLCKSTKTFWERSIETIFVAASLLIFCSCIDLSAQARLTYLKRVSDEAARGPRRPPLARFRGRGLGPQRDRPLGWPGPGRPPDFAAPGMGKRFGYCSNEKISVPPRHRNESKSGLASPSFFARYGKILNVKQFQFFGKFNDLRQLAAIFWNSYKNYAQLK